MIVGAAEFALETICGKKHAVDARTKSTSEIGFVGRAHADARRHRAVQMQTRQSTIGKLWGIDDAQQNAARLQLLCVGTNSVVVKPATISFLVRLGVNITPGSSGDQTGLIPEGRERPLYGR